MFQSILTHVLRDKIGNLYYALTHSPEPLSEEYSYALSWKAATARFEAAGCIPVDEAEQYRRWESSGGAGVEVRTAFCILFKRSLSTSLTLCISINNCIHRLICLL